MRARLAFVAAAAGFGSAEAEAATLTGTVSWSKPQPAQVISVLRDRHVCGVDGPIQQPEIAVDTRGRVAQAVVFVAGFAKDPKLAPREVRFDQKNCVFVPRVAAATLGSLVRLTSSDPVLHNVHVKDAEGRTVANYAMPVMGQEASFRVQIPGPLELRCEAGHDWMRASLFVFEHAFFATTDQIGRYRMTSVPAGRHTLIAWHPELGRVERAIDVPDTKGDVPVDFIF